jgi:lipopolysaccharide/colanic/teichoic acid biosynthesis glycosyltransferase
MLLMNNREQYLYTSRQKTANIRKRLEDHKLISVLLLILLCVLPSVNCYVMLLMNNREQYLYTSRQKTANIRKRLEDHKLISVLLLILLCVLPSANSYVMLFDEQQRTISLYIKTENSKYKKKIGRPQVDQCSTVNYVMCFTLSK